MIKAFYRRLRTFYAKEEIRVVFDTVEGFTFGKIDRESVALKSTVILRHDENFE